MTKLRKGNVYHRISIFMNHSINHSVDTNRAHGRYAPRKDEVGYPILTSDLETPLLVTSGDMFNLVHYEDTPEQHLVVATETEVRKVSKRAVCILLKCFLVLEIYLFKGLIKYSNRT